LDVEKLRILIVGAGIAGLALRLALSRRGCSAQIIERNADWANVGAGMYLPGNAVRALRALQIDTDIRACGAPIETQRFCDHRGLLLSEIDVTSAWRKAGPCIAVHRADLHAALHEASDAARVRMGVALHAVDQNSASVVVHLSNKTQEQYDLVIGADGIRSTVRRLAFSDAGLRPLNQWSWRFVMPCPKQVTTWSVSMNRASACLTMPIGRGRAYGYVDCIGRAVPRNPTNYLQEMLAGFEGIATSVRAALDTNVTTHLAQIEEVVLDGWSHGRVLLIGDAAHAMSPNMAQGAAMAMEDALVLTDCLCEASNVETALHAYEARRAPRIRHLLAMTHRRDRIRQLHPLLRNGLLRSFGHRVYRSHYRPALVEP
jgi:FAD-dependent urate hydroxylase